MLNENLSWKDRIKTVENKLAKNVGLTMYSPVYIHFEIVLHIFLTEK